MSRFHANSLWLLLFLIALAVPMRAVAAQASTITSLISSVNPVKFDQSVTFTATVSAGSGTPTGTVTFADTAITYGTVTLASGTASLSISTLAAGTHQVTALYSGDSSFAPSVSAVLPQDVASAQLFLTLSRLSQPSSRGLIAIGSDSTYTITATNNDVPLANVVITTVIAGRYAVGNVTASAGSCSGSAPVVCTIPSINTGQQVAITLHVAPLLTPSLAAHLVANATVNNYNDFVNVRFHPFVH